MKGNISCYMLRVSYYSFLASSLFTFYSIVPN